MNGSHPLVKRARLTPMGLALLVALLVLVNLFASARTAAASPPQPTYGPAVKDGNPDTGGSGAEWQYRPSSGYPDGFDFWGGMFVAGDAAKQRLGSVYLRYVCPQTPAANGTMYVLVLQNGYPGTPDHGFPVDPLVTNPTGNAWARFGTGGGSDKVYNDSTAGDVLWIGQAYDGNLNHARGYEASFLVPSGSYASFVVHAEALDSSGATATAGTLGFKVADPLVITCPTTNNPAVAIVKSTNGVDANSAPGPTVMVGDAVTWSYVVRNTGNVALTNVTVTDTKGVAVSCPQTVLAVDESMTCTATGKAVAGQYENIGTVQAESSGGAVQDSDPSHYVGLNQAPSITIVKMTNGTDNDTAPGSYIPVGGVVIWTYDVTNSGNVGLTNVSVTDDKGVTVTCPKTTLAVGETMQCTASGTVVAGQYENIGTATGTSPGGPVVSGTNPDHYFGSAPALTLVKTAIPRTYSAVNQVISYDYLVTNSGNVTLIGSFTVSDDKATDESCPVTDSIVPGASITCTASYTISQADLDAGSVTNIAWATNGTVTSPTGSETVTAQQNAALTLVKTAIPQTYSTVGQVITYTFAIKNMSNVTLAGPFTVVDDKLGMLAACAAGPLAPSATVGCTATQTITQDDLNAGSVTNTATATGNGVTSNLATATVTAIQNPKLTQTKVSVVDMSVVGPLDQVDPGDKINYIITAKNEGNVTLTGVTVVDPLIGPLSCTPAQPVTLLPGDSIVCTSSYTLLSTDPPFRLPPIRVCYDSAAACQKPVEGAEVFNRTKGETYLTDARGYIPDGVVRKDDSLWARVVDRVEPQATLYRTSGAPVSVDASSFRSFTDVNDREMRLVIGDGNSLMLYNLTVSAQWYLADDPARVEWLRANLIKASDYLYDFSEGQFALGTVHVKQVYEGWDGANIKLHTSNIFHPNANVGGIVRQETADISPSITMSYTPGSIFIGSYWNRFGTPPNQVNTYKGQVVPAEAMVDDWAIALAHEFGHYLFFLFDTYTDKNGKSSEAIAALCTGSAMGNAYVPENQAYVFSQNHWQTGCNTTEAYFLLNGRNEWDTIHTWYNWTVVPEVATLGGFPPVPLTTVIFDPPTDPVVSRPLASQVFSVTYQATETSSGKALVFLFRDESRVLNQGTPPKNSTSVELIDARVDDRLCVYDISDPTEVIDTPRRQFGCKIIAAGDSNLDLTRDETWSPEVRMIQTGAQQISVTVNQAVTPTNAILRARLIPEYGMAIATLDLTRDGTLWTGVFDLAEPTPPVFLQLWVEEAPDAPQTRREVMTDRGTGGNGAFGPARLHSGVMAVSSDGNANYSSETPLNLAAGQSIAWQGMPGAPPLPPSEQIAGQSYQLDAFPPELVEGGTIGIQFEATSGVASAAEGAAPPTLHFWDGVDWRPLPTTIAAPAGAADGILLANAPSQGAGVYAVLIEDSTPAIFLPLIQR